MGLPTETLDDIAGIAELAQKVVELYYSNPNKPKGKGVTVSISVASFVPKPHTPFQWEPQDTMDMLVEKQKHLLSSVHSKKFRCHGISLPQVFLRAFWLAVTEKSVTLFIPHGKKVANSTAGMNFSISINGWKRSKSAASILRFMPIVNVSMMRSFHGIILITV